ncbi:hypothetical protein GCM10010439_53860 [Actinocorallia aurantiaca]|uniref:Uncharacterized protein n=1 Tax=Actinocorallia aurantiaca TaxID=46204 RepID=A0ABN3UMP9_9ACTN
MAEGRGNGPCELLKNIRAEPGLPVPASGKEIAVFRLTLPTNLGMKRGMEKTGFIQRAEGGSDGNLRNPERLRPSCGVPS